MKPSAKCCAALPGEASGDDSCVDIEDIPRLTDEQLASMVQLRDGLLRKLTELTV